MYRLVPSTIAQPTTTCVHSSRSAGTIRKLHHEVKDRSHMRRKQNPANRNIPTPTPANSGSDRGLFADATHIAVPVASANGTAHAQNTNSHRGTFRRLLRRARRAAADGDSPKIGNATGIAGEPAGAAPGIVEAFGSAPAAAAS